jgi:hypothetical protein
MVRPNPNYYPSTIQEKSTATGRIHNSTLLLRKPAGTNGVTQSNLHLRTPTRTTKTSQTRHKQAVKSIRKGGC